MLKKFTESMRERVQMFVAEMQAEQLQKEEAEAVSQTDVEQAEQQEQQM